MRGGTFILQLKNILALRDAELKRFRMMAILSFLAELFIAGQKSHILHNSGSVCYPPCV